MSEQAAPSSSVATPVQEDRTVAIVSYLTLIGFIVAVVLHSNKKTQIGAFHLRQALGILVTSIALCIAAVILAFIPILGLLCTLAIYAGIFVLWIMGFIAAINGQQKPVPVLGENYQKWFAGAFTA